MIVLEFSGRLIGADSLQTEISPTGRLLFWFDGKTYTVTVEGTCHIEASVMTFDDAKIEILRNKEKSSEVLRSPLVVRLK